MDALVVVVLALVTLLWLSIGVRLVRRAPGERALRAEVDRGLRELQQFLVRH
jgi:hypothetical protein